MSGSKPCANRAAPKPLARVLLYRNEAVLDDFRAKYRVGRAEARAIFEDVLRFLWLGAQPATGELPILAPQLAVDEMWHTFILRTEDYDRFCAKYLGRFLHHRPTDRRARAKGRVPRRELARILDQVVTHLGMETAVRWYRLHAGRYSPERLQRLRRPFPGA